VVQHAPQNDARVAVVIPAFNPGAYLRPTLAALVAQTYLDWEAVVVDDGSTEDLAWVSAVDRRIRLVRQENQGLSAARNAGIAATTAPLVAFLDDDDVWLSDKLLAQVRAFDDDESLALVSTRFEIVDGDGTVTGPGFEGHHDSYESLLEGCGICVSTVVVRRSVLDRVGLFDTTLAGVQDWDLWLRIAQVAKVIRLDEVLARYRIHAEGMSKDWRMTRREARVVLGRHGSHPSARIGIARADELASYQAFDDARVAVRDRRYRVAARSLGFVAFHKPRLLWEHLTRRRSTTP
jgi:glycosyltransferase involved in cell wall biosynthesis